MMKLKLLMPLLLIAGQALAWGPEGHEISAEIAENHLTPTTLKACRAILGDKSLASVANWADEMRDNPKYAYLKQFHFARVPKGQTYETSKVPSGGDILQAAQGLAQYLKTGDDKALSKVPQLTQLSRVEALEMLIHVIPDMHQPLHISDPEDFGANNVKTTFVDEKDPQGTPRSLHGVWDSSMILSQGLGYKQYAAKLDHPTKADMDASQNHDYVTWADEGVMLRVQVYAYPDPQPGPVVDGKTTVLISTKYIKNNMPTVEDRLLRGGLRLAYVLNWVFDPKFDEK